MSLLIKLGIFQEELARFYIAEVTAPWTVSTKWASFIGNGRYQLEA